MSIGDLENLGCEILLRTLLNQPREDQLAPDQELFEPDCGDEGDDGTGLDREHNASHQSYLGQVQRPRQHCLHVAVELEFAFRYGALCGYVPQSIVGHEVRVGGVVSVL